MNDLATIIKELNLELQKTRDLCYAAVALLDAGRPIHPAVLSGLWSAAMGEAL